jgi:hypothetical protein
LVRPIAALLFLVCLGCGDNFQQVQRVDTIEAYEQYLVEYPDGRFVLQANSRLESLYLDKARAEKNLEAYDAYLERFPEGDLRTKALGEREEFLFDWARSENTAESWDTFLAEYPKAQKDRRSRAKRMVSVHEYQPKLDIEAPTMEQINLAEDPEGPLNGWRFEVLVTNNGDKTIESLSMTMEYLDGDARPLESKEWPLVAPYWPTPIEQERKVPMKPGETRPWEWSTGSVPEGWARRVRVYPSRIAFYDPSAE